MRRAFRQVDVFGAAPFAGNPLAVVHDAEGLATEEMQRFASWTNLSETVFLLPPTGPGADYRLRIFTVAEELPFAGHPTLGACHAWLEGGGEPRKAGVVVQECGAGLVPIRRSGDGLAFAAPPLVRSGPVEEGFLAEVAEVLRVDRSEIVDAQWADNGPGWVAVLLRDADAVLAVEPDFGRYRGEGGLDIGLVGPCGEGAECAFEVRAVFTDGQGMREDPVTGSLNASVAQWLLATGRATAPYLVRQGTRLGRAGRVRIEQGEDRTVWVGGATVTAIAGAVEIP